MNSIVRSICILTFLTQCSAYGMIEGDTPATQAGLLPSITDIPQQPSLSSFNHKIKIGAIIMGATCIVGGCWYGWHKYKASCHERQRTDQQNLATTCLQLIAAPTEQERNEKVLRINQWRDAGITLEDSVIHNIYKQAATKEDSDNFAAIILLRIFNNQLSNLHATMYNDLAGQRERLERNLAITRARIEQLNSIEQAARNP